jgi:acetylornithine deacetylase/succinyl-diaminopimelate desuccinylase-like protein
MIGYGPPPGSIHGVDEFVTVSDLVRCAQTLALTAIRWCGVGGDR